MQFSRALIVFFAVGLASAQLPDVPSCSLSCFLTALTSDGCSELTDFACHCQKPSLVSTITPCVQKACNVADQSSVSNAVVSQCSSAGHPISIPPIGSGSTTSASSSETSVTTTTGSGSSSSSTQGSATATGTVTSTTVTSSGSVSPTSSSAASSSPVGSSTPVGSSSHAHTGSSSASHTVSSSPSASSPVFTGAAGNVKGNMAGVAAVAAAAAYML